jgi:hypothetical protein
MSTKSPAVFPHGTDTSLIDNGHIWLNQAARERDGAKCPCCGSIQKYTGYKLNSSLARLLIICYRTYPVNSIINVKDIIKALGRSDVVKGREWNKLGYWGLLQPVDATGAATIKPTDLCRLVQRGQDFVYNNLHVVKKIWVGSHEVKAAEADTITILGALGRNYGYEELMNEEYKWTNTSNHT